MVDEAGRVDGRQALGGLGEPLHALVGLPQVLLVDRLEAQAVDVLHDEVFLAARGGPVLGRPDDVRVADLDGDRPFARAFLVAGGAGVGLLVLAAVQHLQADGLPRLGVDGLVDPGHAPLRGDRGDVELDVETPLDVDARAATAGLRRGRGEDPFQLADHVATPSSSKPFGPGRGRTPPDRLRAIRAVVTNLRSKTGARPRPS